MSEPTEPPAPALFSTITGWPRRGVSFSAMMRATVSVEPPAENGTTSLMGLAGQDCAREAAGKRRDAVRRGRQAGFQSHFHTSFSTRMKFPPRSFLMRSGL